MKETPADVPGGVKVWKGPAAVLGGTGQHPVSRASLSEEMGEEDCATPRDRIYTPPANWAWAPGQAGSRQRHGDQNQPPAGAAAPHRSPQFRHKHHGASGASNPVWEPGACADLQQRQGSLPAPAAPSHGSCAPSPARLGGLHSTESWFTSSSSPYQVAATDLSASLYAVLL